MWIVQLSFTRETERLAARAAHRDRLVALYKVGTVRMAGPFADDGGAVILLDVPHRRAVDEILTADPYFTTPGVTISQIHEWTPFLQ